MLKIALNSKLLKIYQNEKDCFKYICYVYKTFKRILFGLNQLLNQLLIMYSTKFIERSNKFRKLFESYLFDDLFFLNNYARLTVVSNN